MKLWQCDWVPSSVADWLCRELDERGIPGTTYTHTVLSLLHPYFCPHPVPKEPGLLHKGFINFGCINSILSSGLHQEFEVLYEELEDNVHPDADFPELKFSEPLKAGNRRSKKRQKRKLQQLSLSPEKLWKTSALHCLLTASDEPHNLEIVIEELFLRLKDTCEPNRKKEIKLNTLDNILKQNKKQGYIADFYLLESSIADSFYCSNFPPLSTNLKDSEDIKSSECALNWKSIIKNKLSPEKEKKPSPPKCNQMLSNLKDLEDASAAGPLAICSNGSEKGGENLEMEIRPRSVENGPLENEAYCFIPILSGEADEFVTRAHLEIDIDAEARVKNICQLKESGIAERVDRENRGKLEEWECAGNLLSEPTNRAVSVDLLGNRLYERSLCSADTTRCNSNSDLNAILQNEDSRHEEIVSNPGTSVWGYASEPRTVPYIENVWNSSAFAPQTFDDSSNVGNISSSMKMNPDSFVDNVNEFDSLHIKNLCPGNWSSNQNWNSLALITPKSDPVFSSAFLCSPHTVYKEETRQDCKESVPDINNENVKNIWSDLNDNVTSGKNRLDTKNDVIRGSPNDLMDFNEIHSNSETEETLCKSFQHLGLEHLWENPILLDGMNEESLTSKDFGTESSSASFLDDFSKDPQEQSLPVEEMFGLKCLQTKEIEDNFLIHKIPSGPSGPYVDLRHTEASGFEAVVPQDKNIHIDSDHSSEQETILLFTPKDTNDSSEHSLTMQEEENLLTSPRTHFRPIRQDSHGSVDEGKSEDGRAVNSVTNVLDPNLVFRRTGSGTLYLESDLLKGSPKKYMAYREPPAKVPGVAKEVQDFAVLSQVDENPSQVFVPKFKLINNEKFCQTEEPEGPKNIGENIGKELQSRFMQTNLSRFDFVYQNSDQNWDGKHPEDIKLKWEESSKSVNKEAWELELSGSLSYPKWSTHDLSQTDWSNTTPVQTPMQKEINRGVLFEQSEDSRKDFNSGEDAFSKIKFIWNSSKETTPKLPSGTNPPRSTNVPIEFSSEAISATLIEKHDAGLQSDLMLGSSLVIKRNPWNVDVGLKRDENDLKSLKREEPIGLASRRQLQWEVDQEADEILGGLLPPSPLKSSPPYGSPLKNPGIQADLDEFKFLDFFEGQDQQPIEDLDNLEPGWDLNEGFEWGPATEEIFFGDDDDGGGEVLIYENEDGQTVMLPVEYIDDSLYDQLFGSADTPIGGSLPDLPGGQFHELKKGSLSYKISRRARGEKFVPSSRRPCSFFLEGNCRRSDCKFSHDLLTITCRFWEEGSCLKGDTCPFRHGFPPARRRNRSEGDQASLVAPLSLSSLKEGHPSECSRGRPIPKKNRSCGPTIRSFELDSETDFPVLGSSVESKSGSLDDQNFPSNIKFTKLAKKKKKFITVTKNLLKMESDSEFVSSKVGGNRRSKGCRSTSIDVVASAGEDRDGCLMLSSTKKKGKGKGRDNHGSECETLRKVLRKRFPIPSQPPFRHEDGTLSDF